jgi:hypothetical protein
MRRVIFGNIDYQTHMTSEGGEFQRGLVFAGWTITGKGFYPNHERDVLAVLDKHRPDVVLVHDKRDFDPCHGGFMPGIMPQNLHMLAEQKTIFKLAVVKDAGSSIDYHRAFCEQIKADAVVTYYHDESVLKLSPFLASYDLLRTYHTVDADEIRKLNLTGPRLRALVSGAVSSVYPTRQRAIEHRSYIGLDVLPHPGYNNKQSSTPGYLSTLSKYRVHVATASAYGFALRKIIESVAVGTTPVTNLPTYDVLPFIDGALVRISKDASREEIKDAVARADAGWNLSERLHFSRLACQHYDWRIMGEALSELIERRYFDHTGDLI